ncbi:MAG: ABC transporter ATP-binding protein [Candidatus Krumholzibacteria bacterium]|jgi:ABC-2 type transport system ATP-binding protein|nr:ABC transporter ATP-binding protein [Candidatus Krumholzibacteria bacterium]
MLKVQNLSKNFGDIRAVADVSFEVVGGRIFGLLGPNGAGKTTTISMIAGLVPPAQGSIRVDGIDLAADPAAVKQRLGVVPQEIALYEDLTARENIDFWGGIYGLRGRALAARRDELLAVVGLADRAREPVRNFSGGMKRRLNLALGLVHEPKLVLLDEPTVGIDPQARINVLAVVRDLAARGAAVLYTTHYLEEAESLCDELAIMDHGTIHAQGTIDTLKAELGEGSVLTVQGGFAKETVAAVVERSAELRALEIDDGRALLNVPRGRAGVGAALEVLYNSGLQLSDVTIKEPNLQDLFLKLTGRDLRD